MLLLMGLLNDGWGGDRVEVVVDVVERAKIGLILLLVLMLMLVMMLFLVATVVVVVLWWLLLFPGYSL